MKKDKVLHFAAGFIIATVSALMFPAGVTALLVLAAAVGKEIFDKFRHGKPDAMDVVATIAGGIAGYIALAVVGG